MLNFFLFALGVISFYLVFWFGPYLIISLPALGLYALSESAAEKHGIDSRQAWAYFKIYMVASFFLDSLIPAIIYSLGIFVLAGEAAVDSSMPKLYWVLGGILALAISPPNGNSGCSLTVPSGGLYLVMFLFFQDMAPEMYTYFRDFMDSSFVLIMLVLVILIGFSIRSRKRPRPNDPG